MKAKLVQVEDHGKHYEALQFVCPGCQASRTLPDGTEYAPSGLHMLPVNTTEKSPSWSFDGNLDAPTISPSILTQTVRDGVDVVCHSFLKAGVFDFLGDCTHPLAGQQVPLPDLPEWAASDE